MGRDHETLHQLTGLARRRVRVGPRTVGKATSSVLLLALAIGASGCIATRMAPVLPPPVRLGAFSDFTLYAVDSTTQELREHCLVRRIDANLLAVRADTLLLSNVEVVDWARSAPACVPTDTMVLLSSRNPSVQSERTTVSGKRTALLAVATAAVSVFWLGVWWFIRSINA